MTLKKDSPVTNIKGVGDKQSDLFFKLNVHTVQDLLFHIPFRYQDTSQLLCIQDFKENGEGTFLAQIDKVSTTYYRRQITSVRVSDDTGSLTFRFFNQPYLQKTLTVCVIYILIA
jgi:ATP-dependent DNA helicase RecG